MDILVTAGGVLEFNGQRMQCALGRSGVTRDKIEGDGATPTGCFVLRRVLFRPDRVDPPVTPLPVQAIRRNDGWCDDPDDPAYNCPVTLPHAASAETLWRNDGLYDVIVVVGHNDNPTVSGAGSAIFMHVARDNGAPTEGCVALALPDLLVLLDACAAGDRLCVIPRNTNSDP